MLSGNMSTVSSKNLIAVVVVLAVIEILLSTSETTEPCFDATT